MANRICWVVLLSALSFGGCNDPILGEDTARGDYTLVSVNGSTPPVVISETPSGATEITGGSLRLGSSGGCDLVRDYRTTSDGTTTTERDTDSCNWTRTGSAIFLTLEAGGAVPGTWDEEAATVTFGIGGNDLRFAR